MEKDFREHEDAPYVRRGFVMLILRLCIDQGIDVREAVSQVVEMSNDRLLNEIKVIDQNLYRRINDRIEERDADTRLTLFNCFAPLRQLQNNCDNYMEFLEGQSQPTRDKINQITNSLIKDMGDHIGTSASTDPRLKTARAEIGFTINALQFQRVIMFMSMTEIEPETAIARVDTVFGNAAPPNNHELLGVVGNAHLGGSGVVDPVGNVHQQQRVGSDDNNDDDDDDDGVGGGGGEVRIEDNEGGRGVGGGAELDEAKSRGAELMEKISLFCFYATRFFVLFFTIFFAMKIYMKYFRPPADAGNTAPSVGSTQEGSDSSGAVGSGASTVGGKGSLDFDASNVTSDKACSNATSSKNSGAGEISHATATATATATGQSNSISTSTSGGGTASHFQSAHGQGGNTTHEGGGNVLGASSDFDTISGAGAGGSASTSTEKSRDISTNTTAGQSNSSFHHEMLAKSEEYWKEENKCWLVDSSFVAVAEVAMNNATNEFHHEMLAKSEECWKEKNKYWLVDSSFVAVAEVAMNNATNEFHHEMLAKSEECWKEEPSSTPSPQPSSQGPSTGDVSEGALDNGRDQSKFDKLQSEFDKQHQVVASQNYELARLRKILWATAIIIPLLIALLLYLCHSLRQKSAERIRTLQNSLEEAQAQLALARRWPPFFFRPLADDDDDSSFGSLFEEN